MDQFANMFDLGGGCTGVEGGRGSPQMPPLAQQRWSHDNDSFREYSLVSNQQAGSVTGPPTGDVELSLRGSNDPRTIWVATESQSREGGNDEHHTETTQAGPGPGGQGTATTPPNPGVQPQPGGPLKW